MRSNDPVIEEGEVMILHYVEAPNPIPLHLPFPKLFLGGGISYCPDWQTEIVKALSAMDTNVTVINPRRKDFPIDDPTASKTQITWEYNALHLVNIIAFWFAKGSLNPITLYEYGAALERQNASVRPQTLVVGCDPQYPRIQDVLIQTRLISSNQRVTLNFGSFIKDLIETIQKWETSLTLG
jgi:hypothetical protein